MVHGMTTTKIKMLDVSLPERSLENIRSILEANSMPPRIPEATMYNCWGFTAYYFGWEENAKWLPSYKMEEHLKSNTVPVHLTEVRAGDIAVFRFGRHLEHTAIVMPNTSVVCHKPGGGLLCIETMQGAQDKYGKEITYVRNAEKNSTPSLDNSLTCASIWVTKE